MLNKEDLTAEELELVEKMESKYPQMTSAFKEIQKRNYLTFLKKNYNYGPNAITRGRSLDGPDGDKNVVKILSEIETRIFDKMFRLENMLENSVQDMVGESIEDTVKDCEIYFFIMEFVKNKVWSK
jgi:hypothetical protein